MSFIHMADFSDTTSLHHMDLIRKKKKKNHLHFVINSLDILKDILQGN